ncbi:MAG: hypothetical protein HZB29_03070 [Nitrospinae bacterium]|nr:hypothetical protein [Nitrospinota bacterium]
MMFEQQIAALIAAVTPEDAESIRTARLWMTLGLGAAATIAIMVFGKPLERFIERIQPDEGRRQRSFFIVLIMLFSILGAVVSILIMLKMLGVIPSEQGE